MDYPTVKHLAYYLKYLAWNKTAYNSYFQWKKHIKFGQKKNNFANRDPHQQLCEMCIKLHLDSFFKTENTIIKDLSKDWNNRSCNLNRTLIYKKIYKKH